MPFRIAKPPPAREPLAAVAVAGEAPPAQLVGPADEDGVAVVAFGRETFDADNEYLFPWVWGGQKRSGFPVHAPVEARRAGAKEGGALEQAGQGGGPGPEERAPP